MPENNSAKTIVDTDNNSHGVATDTLKHRDPVLCPETERMVNAMTVDVEDYFQVSAFEPYIERSTWDSFDCRVEANMDRILELFDQRSVKGTFFTLGWIAERYPSMTRRITEEGHEIASHGSEHVMVTRQTPEQFKVDLSTSREILEQTCGEQVRGFRAPSYSINQTNLWAHDVMLECGYTYSSSIAPIKHDLYGMPDAPRFAHYRHCGESGEELLEIPITTVKVGERNVPCGGGGWFRLYPYSLTRWALNKVNAQDRESAVFYIHPWEIDPQQPRQNQADWKTRFRHYVNLGSTFSKVDKLLKDFAWNRMDRIFESERSGFESERSGSDRQGS